MKEEDGSPAVKSANRVLDVFELFARRGRPMSHTEIAEQLAIPKSSLSNLLATLAARGYLELTADRRSYRLGESLLALARRQAVSADLVTVAGPVLRALTRACGESSALNQLNDDETVVTCTEMGPHRLVSHMRNGDRAPLYATSSGKAILAFMAEDDRAAYLARVRFVAITPKTLSSVTMLRKELLAVRKTGMAFSREEFTPGIVGMAMPLLDESGAVLGAINVAMPAVRFNARYQKQIAAHLEAAVKAMRKQLRTD